MSLAVDRVTVGFGDRLVLDDVGFTVADGHTTSVIGPSGSGKSTLLRVIAGLLTPDSGSVSIDGTDVTRMPAHRRRVGLVFQDNQLFPHLDVRANVGFGLRMQRADRAVTEARVGELLELVGLADRADSDVTVLSGGEAKRVALARALAPRPRVLLFDEPFSGLHRALRDRLLADLRHILDSTDVSSVLVTHDRDEAEALSSDVVDLG